MKYRYHATMAWALNIIAARLSLLHRWGDHKRTRRIAGRLNLKVGGWSNYHEAERDKFIQSSIDKS